MRSLVRENCARAAAARVGAAFRHVRKGSAVTAVHEFFTASRVGPVWQRGRWPEVCGGIRWVGKLERRRAGRGSRAAEDDDRHWRGAPILRCAEASFLSGDTPSAVGPWVRRVTRPVRDACSKGGFLRSKKTARAVLALEAARTSASVDRSQR